MESTDPELLAQPIPGEGPGAGSPLRIASWASELASGDVDFALR